MLKIKFAGFHNGRDDMPSHAHDTWEIVYQFTGSVITVQEDQPYAMSPGMMLINPARVPHHDVYQIPYELIYLFVEGEVLAKCDRLLWDDKDRSFGRTFELILKEWLRPGAYRGEMLDALGAQLEILLLRQLKAEKVSSPRDVRVITAEKLMRTSHGTPLTVEEICQQTGVSRTWLFRAFRDAYGCTPHEYLEKVRLERAVALLRHSTHTVSYIALDCGYCSTSHFTNHVKKTMGKTPTQIRAASAARG